MSTEPRQDRQPNARDEMDRAVMCLAIAVEEEVWLDVKAKWDAVRPLVVVAAPGSSPTPGETT